MRRIAPKLLILVFTVLLASCGNQPGQGEDPIKPPPGPGPDPVDPGEVKASLYLFAAPWCGPCKEELPAVQSLYNERLADRKDLLVRVYVTTGATQFKNPTQEIADAYGEQLGISFEMVPDLEVGARIPKWPNYRKYIGTGFSLPAAAILDKDGNVVKVYKSPDPTEMVEDVESQLNK